jgi:hypothetical protein
VGRWRRPLSRRCDVEETYQRPDVAQSCPDCHALVSDLAAHARWHSRLVADLAVAVEQEIKRTSGAAG